MQNSHFGESQTQYLKVKISHYDLHFRKRKDKCIHQKKNESRVLFLWFLAMFQTLRFKNLQNIKSKIWGLCRFPSNLVQCTLTDNYIIQFMLEKWEMLKSYTSLISNVPDKSVWLFTWGIRMHLINCLVYYV